MVYKIIIESNFGLKKKLDYIIVVVTDLLMGRYNHTDLGLCGLIIGNYSNNNMLFFLHS